MHIVHLTASSFYGGPERQMLGLARALPDRYRTTFLSFPEKGRCGEFLGQVDDAGFEGQALRCDTPRLRSTVREVAAFLELRQADLLICHGYKSNIIGRMAARRTGRPVVSVSRGWTGENVKVRVYEKVDRMHLRYMDAVVAVSEGQAAKVRRAAVPEHKLTIIRNAARLDAFERPRPEYRLMLRHLARADANDVVIVAAGRLSPEKGFHVLVEAAAIAGRSAIPHRIVLFGDGAQRSMLEERIAALGLRDRFTLAGFHPDLDRYLPWADLVVLPSFTEGLPNVALEASAAAVAVVATAVGGTPEVVRDGVNGSLVPPGDPAMLAERIAELCVDGERRHALGQAGRRLMQEQFSFEAQALAYQKLFTQLVKRPALAAA